MGLIVPLAIAAGTSLASRMFAGKMKGPVDTTGVDREYWNRGRVNLESSLDRRYDQLLATEAQTGMTSSAATSQKQDFFRNSSSTMADFEAQMSQALARSKAHYLQGQRQFENQQVQTKANAIAQLGGAAMNAYMNKELMGDTASDGELVNKIKGWFGAGSKYNNIKPFQFTSGDGTAMLSGGQATASPWLEDY